MRNSETVKTNTQTQGTNRGGRWFHRLARLVALPVLAAGILAATAPAASAATLDHFAIGRFSCPGNQMIVSAPSMTSLSGGTENAKWYPVVQRWNGSAWVNYWSVGAFNGVATRSGTTNWTHPSGQPSGGSWVANVAPGSWYNGRYYYNYYRVVNYVGWANMNDQFIAGWYGPYASLQYSSSTNYSCMF